MQFITSFAEKKLTEHSIIFQIVAVCISIIFVVQNAHLRQNTNFEPIASLVRPNGTVDYGVLHSVPNPQQSLFKARYTPSTRLNCRVESC